MSSLGPVVEHVVEGHNFHHLDGRGAEDLGDLLCGLGRDVAELLLDEMKRGQQRTAPLRVLRDLEIDPSADVGRDHHSSAPFFQTYTRPTTSTPTKVVI